MGVYSFSSLISITFYSFLTSMRARLVWVSPDNASLHYNNSAEILKRLTLSLLQNNYNVDPIIYVYTFDNINSTNSSYDGIPVGISLHR